MALVDGRSNDLRKSERVLASVKQWHSCYTQRMSALAYFRGRFVPREEVLLDIDDLGFLQGVTVAEQLRTFGGKLFRLEQHLERLGRSLAIVGVDPGLPLTEIRRIGHELVERNHPLLAAGDDLGLTIFVTPGTAADHRPTLALHTQPVAFGPFAAKYESGESLVVSSIRQVPASSWPSDLKCRSRMHYFLADQEARRLQPGSRALILDQAGQVCEATTANILIYRDGEGLFSPPVESILPGITLGAIADLARAEGIPLTHRPLWPEDILTADEVLLSSTSPCLLPVIRVGEQPIGGGQPGPIFQRLLAAFSREIGLDIAAQARQFGVR